MHYLNELKKRLPRVAMEEFRVQHTMIIKMILRISVFGMHYWILVITSIFEYEGLYYHIKKKPDCFQEDSFRGVIFESI